MQTAKQVFTFDVFDTCVSRTFAHPTDLFHELGVMLASVNLAKDDVEYFAQNFRQSRIRAEKKAYRSVRPGECANIFEIYEQFRLPAGLEIAPSEIIDAEIALERASMYAIPEVVEEIRRIRRNGSRIIFISDMYLPADILSPMLVDLGVMQKSEKLYVSCDVRLTKSSGNLFKHVIQHEHLEPANIVHLGDNHRSDVEIARRIGIAARHFDKAHLNQDEQKIARAHGHFRSSMSSIAALSRQSRLTVPLAEDGESSALDRLLHSTVSPFLVAFVRWVLTEARKSGIGRLYFVARDGQVLHKIASELMRGDSSIELRYLYGSRRAWLPPSITRDSMVWTRLVATPGQSNTYSDMLSRMGLESSQQIKIRKELGISEDAWNLSLSEQLAFQFLEKIFSKEEISDFLLQAVRHLRQLALKYFSQEGLLDNVRWALVDAGWTLNCQAAIKRILSQINGKRFEPTGFYISLTNDHLSTHEAGAARSFIVEPGSIFSRRRVIIEHCFTPSTHTSTQSYEERNGIVVPVFGPELRNNNELEYAQRLQDIAIHYARLVKANESIGNKLATCNVNVIRNAEKFISNPSKRDVKFMSSFGTIADLRHEKSFIRPLCKPLKLRELGSIIGTTFSRKKRFGNPAFMWLEGSCALSPIYIRLPIHLMLFGDSILSKLKRWWRKKS